MQANTLAEQLFFTTTRIVTFYENGDNGYGTGFFFRYESQGKEQIFLVTNKHVVKGSTRGEFTFFRNVDGEFALGVTTNLIVNEAEWSQIWFGHPDSDVDIAICLLEPLIEGVGVYLRTVDSCRIPDAELIQELDALEPIVFVGYPSGIWDSKNGLPVIRQGFTASPVSVDFEKSPKFLIDASVFQGSSGSPVFILNKGPWQNRQGELVGGDRFYFVGVIAAVYSRTHLNEIVPIAIPTVVKPMAKQEERINLGIVFKSRTVIEAIEAFMKQS